MEHMGIDFPLKRRDMARTEAKTEICFMDSPKMCLGYLHVVFSGCAQIKTALSQKNLGSAFSIDKH